MKQSFQAGVDTLYNKCVSCGSTPSSKTPTAISDAIQSIYNNRYNAGVSATKKGNATTANVLSGKTFTSTAGVNLTGTMPNRGTLNWSSSNTTYTVPAGYYSGGTLDSRPSYTAGYNAGQSASAYKGYDYTLKICCGTLDNTQNESRVYLPLTGASSVHINGSIVNQYAAGDITINNENVWHRDNAYASHSIADTWKSTDPNGTGSIYIYLYGINTHSTGITLNVSVH